MTLPRLLQLCSSLGHETRARVFFHVLESPDALHSAAIAGIVGIREGLASYHLKELQEADLVSKIISGKYALFIVNRRTLFELANFFHTLTGGTLTNNQPANDRGMSEEEFFKSDYEPNWPENQSSSPNT